MDKAKSVILTLVAAKIRNSDCDLGDGFHLSEVDRPPRLSGRSLGARRCSRVTVNSLSCTSYACAELFCVIGVQGNYYNHIHITLPHHAEESIKKNITLTVKLVSLLRRKTENDNHTHSIVRKCCE